MKTKNALNLFLFSLIVIACAGEKSNETLNRLSFNSSLETIKGVEPAKMTEAQKNAFESLRNYRDSRALNEFGDPLNGDSNWTSKNFISLGKFLLQVAKSADSKVENESRTGVFDLDQRSECYYWQSSEDPSLEGDMRNAAVAEVNYSKSTEELEAKQKLENGRFEMTMDWKSKLENCRSDADWETENKFFPYPDYPDYPEKDWDRAEQLRIQITEIEYRIEDFEIENPELKEKLEKINARVLEIEALLSDLNIDSDTAGILKMEVEALIQQELELESLLKSYESDLEKLKSLRAELTPMEEQYESDMAEYEKAELEHERLVALRDLGMEGLFVYNRNGEVEGRIEALLIAQSDPLRRISYLEMEKPNWDEVDDRTPRSLEEVEGSIQVQSSLDGKIETQGFDPESKSMIPYSVNFRAVVVAVDMRVEDLKDLTDLHINDLIPEDERKQEIQDVLESNLLCAGEVEFDDGAKFQCASIIQMYIQDYIKDLFGDD